MERKALEQKLTGFFEELHMHPELSYEEYETTERIKRELAAEEISYRAMMGEFIIYYRGKIVGGIYDDRLLVKPVKAALSYLWVIKSFCRDCSLRCMGSCRRRKGRKRSRKVK